jgi:hypothetical protein
MDDLLDFAAFYPKQERDLFGPSLSRAAETSKADTHQAPQKKAANASVSGLSPGILIVRPRE